MPFHALCQGSCQPDCFTDQKDWSCIFTFDPVIPVELRFQPCPFRGTKYSKLPVVIKKTTWSKSQCWADFERERSHSRDREKAQESIVYGVSVSARLEDPFLIALSSTLSKTPSVLFHKTSLGQRSYLPRRSCWENFFFLRTTATYRKG